MTKMSKETNSQKHQPKKSYTTKKDENKRENQANHPRGWCKINHYGMCGQNCPCCRANAGDTFGVCPICK